MNLANKQTTKDLYHNGVLALRPVDLIYDRKDGKKWKGRAFEGFIVLEDGRKLTFRIKQEAGQPVFTTTKDKEKDGKVYKGGDVIFMDVSVPKKQGGVL